MTTPKMKTSDVVATFKDPRIKYIKRTRNSGSDTYLKNEGILASKGEYNLPSLMMKMSIGPDHFGDSYKEMTMLQTLLL